MVFHPELQNDYYVHVHGMHAQWGLRVQIEMLVFMDRNNLTATQACDKKNGARHHVPYETLRRWWKHFELWGETPFQTARRTSIRFGKDRLDPGIGERIIQLLEEDSSRYLDEIQDCLINEFQVRYHTSTIS